MGETFSGLGSTLYIGKPGQPIEEMTEVKLQHASELHCECDISVDEEEAAKVGGFPLTFEVTGEALQLSKSLEVYLRRSQESHEGWIYILDEATALMALWLAGGRCIARYNRLRRHYNRWRRSYATRKTFYAPPFNKFLHSFMVHYVGMRNYHSENK